MKAEEKKLAIKLRKEGKVFREILEQVDVSKSTLSLWLREIPLSEKHLRRIKNLKDAAREKASISIKSKWKRKYNKIYDEYEPPFSEPFFMLGLGIYMGEGSKYSRCVVGLANSDKKILLIFKKWIEKYFAEKNFKWRGYVATHSGKDIIGIKLWWSKKMKIPLQNFNKTNVTVNKISQRKKNILKFGTFHLRAGGNNIWEIACKIKKSIDYAPVV